VSVDLAAKSSLATTLLSCTTAPRLNKNVHFREDDRASESNEPKRRKTIPLPISREERVRPFLENPLLSTTQHHESTSGQMLTILRRLPDTLSTFESLRHWIYGPHVSKINIDLVQRLRNVEDREAEFLLRSISRMNVIKTEEQERLCTLKRDLRPNTTITTEDGDSFTVRALLDPGCTDSAIDRKFVQREKIETKTLPTPKTSYNADGTTNVGGSITEYVSLRLDVNGHSDLRHLVVTDLSYDVFIGFDWISYHNPEVNWQTEEIKFT